MLTISFDCGCLWQNGYRLPCDSDNCKYSVQELEQRQQQAEKEMEIQREFDDEHNPWRS
jgi:hypothetical protein